MTCCGLAIFVKTPTLSPVKTRLWPALGRDQATVLFQHAADATRSVVARTMADCSLQGYWAVAEAAASHEQLWTELPTVAQGGGGLGERMAHVYSQLRREHHAGILIGADSPQLSATALTAAAAWLDSSQPRLVIGRADDGGFWLFGGNVELPGAGWTRPTYSDANTARQFRDAWEEHGEWLELSSLRDIDRAEDVEHVVIALSELTDPTSEQSKLKAFLEDLKIHVDASI